jgi:hypothetical protein
LIAGFIGYFVIHFWINYFNAALNAVQ